MSPKAFVDQAFSNPVNRTLFARLATLELGDCFLTAGCLAQAVWNLKSGRPPGWGVKDYDVSYFDDRDLSWEAEDAVIRRIEALTADLAVKVEVRNQARVHLWYGERFGEGYPQLRSTRDGVDRFLICCTCVGLDVRSGEIYAPYGLDELMGGVLRMNPVNPRPELFRDKAETYRSRWPWLTIQDCEAL